MSVYTKNNEGKVTKIAGMITQRLNTRWFLCARSLEDGIEYYTVPADAQSYFKNIDAFTIYSFGFNEPNTTLSPKLRYGNTVLDIRDFTNEGGDLVIGQLSGVYQMFTQDLNNDPKIYFVGTTHPDAIDAEVSTTSTNAVQNQAITKYANDLLSKASKVEIDNTSITKNTQEQIQAVGVMDETNNVNKVHSALTKEQFNALTEYDENTFYPITDETGVDSIGGASGAITLGTGLSIENNVLSASGGLQEVKASDVNSETATQGQVLTADGSGGASWQNASGGGSQLYQHCINVYDAFRYTNFYAILITSSPTLFDYSSLLNYIKDKGEFSCTGTGSFDKEKKYLIKTFSYGGDSAIFISTISDLSTYDDRSGVCSATDVYDVVTPL